MTTDRNAAKQAGNGRARKQDVLGSNSEIGRKLKQYYDGLVSEDVPDRFAQLLSQLEDQEKSTSPQVKE